MNSKSLRKVGLALGSLAAACANDPTTPPVGGADAVSASSGASSGGAGGSNVASTAAPASQTAVASTVGVGGASGTGGAAPKCDPPPPEGSLYALAAPQLGAAGDVSMCDYRGKVVLIVNTAAA